MKFDFSRGGLAAAAAGNELQLANPIEALYLHIPFCKQRCAYCDFATGACNDDAVMDAYVDALCLAVRRASRAGLLGAIRTIYIGGGTPTHLGMRRLNSLIYMLSVSINLENLAEFTLECNPESLTQAMVKDLFALGVSRFSIGAQSFDDAVLREYGRIHDAKAIEAAVTAAQARTDNVSIDLICGGPSQTMQSWEASLVKAVELGVKHISIYPLTIEQGTPLDLRIQAGECPAPSDDAEADMMLAAQRVLGAAGMQRYEVASYAFEGYESQHNTAYWTGVEYLGLGAGASSMLSPDNFQRCVDAGLFGNLEGLEGEAWSGICEGTSRLRVATHADSGAFSENLGKPCASVEQLTEKEAVLEDIMLGFRRSAGVSEEKIKAACSLVPELAETVDSLVADGLLVHANEGFAPTANGWLLGNEVYGAIWDLSLT